MIRGPSALSSVELCPCMPDLFDRVALSAGEEGHRSKPSATPESFHRILQNIYHGRGKRVLIIPSIWRREWPLHEEGAKTPSKRDW